MESASQRPAAATKGVMLKKRMRLHTLLVHAA
jgi:hypothetical protein